MEEGEIYRNRQEVTIADQAPALEAGTIEITTSQYNARRRPCRIGPKLVNSVRFVTGYLKE